MTNKFIDLDRYFALVPSEMMTRDDDDAQRVGSLAPSLQWHDLLTKHRVVILAEPGAGKTWEIRHAAQKLRAKNTAAFFLKLEHVADHLDTSFDVGTYEEFTAWLSGSEEGWIFLDSVDEARLVDPRDFEKAVRRLGKAVGGAKQRAHIYVTSRLHEWRWNSDARLVTEKLAYQPPAGSKKQNEEAARPGRGRSTSIQTKTTGESKREIMVVALSALTREQMERFASERYVEDAREMIEEVVRQDATQFASRPLDLDELIDYWRTHREIGRRIELIRSSIDNRLKEHDGNRMAQRPLSMERARDGVRRLAAAVTFQRTDRIVIPGAEASRRGVLATDILDDWTEREVITLLGRPVFEEPIFGTVRFHHRSLSEFLAAEWLYELLIDGKSRRAIEGLFFTEQYGLETVSRRGQAVLSWLALWDDALRGRALKVAPEVLIDGGDPSELAVDIREVILRKFCEEHDRTQGHYSFDAASIQRFAHRDLAATINDLLQRYGAHDEIAVVLLTMVWQGRIEHCHDLALKLATDPSVCWSTRIAAVRAVFATASGDRTRLLRDAIASSITVKDEAVAAALLTEASIISISSKLLLDLIDRLERPRQFSYRSFDGALERVIAAFPVGDVSELCSGILKRLQEPPFIERRYFEVSQRNVWLLKYGTQACERLAIAQHRDALSEPVLALMTLTSLGAHYHDAGGQEHKLRELVPAWRELNYALFWYEIAHARAELDKQRGERLTELWQARIFRDFTEFGVEDFDQIVRDVQGRALLDDRLVALSLAHAIYLKANRPKRWLRALHRVADGAAELKERLQRLLRPTLSPELRKHRASERNFKIRQQEREAKKAQKLEKWNTWLRAHTNVLRDVTIAPDGSVWKATNYLLQMLRQKKPSSSSKWAEGNWRALIPEQGEEVARAFRDGAVAYWRHYKPKLLSEGVEHPNSVPNAIIVGLTGLEIETRETDTWASSLSESEAELACRYAIWELNGFPDWLPKLYAEHRATVRTVLLGEMRWEIETETSEETSGYIISDLEPYGEWLREDVAGELLDIVKKHAPASERLTRDALTVVLRSATIKDDAIAGVASAHARAVGDNARKALWLATWASVDCDAALDLLEQDLNAREPAGATELVMLFAASLLGDRRRNLKQPRLHFRTPQRLLRLYRILHKHIKRRDDLDRIGRGCYSPTLRDDAQEARDRVFTHLREMPGKDAYLAVRTIADETTDNPSLRRWLDYHARSKVETDADAATAAWTEADVRSFGNERERKPRTHHELFMLVTCRLEDMKDSLEHGDSSLAGLLMHSPLEHEHRKFVGHWLREKAIARYVVPQEEELADAKRPDMRIHPLGFDAPLPIELKIADKWSGPDLFERLRNQLCGDYLRDQRSRCGVFLLINRGVAKQSWDHPTTQARMTFAELVVALQAHAASHIANIEKIDAVRVIGIDLTLRAADASRKSSTGEKSKRRKGKKHRAGINDNPSVES